MLIVTGWESCSTSNPISLDGTTPGFQIDPKLTELNAARLPNVPGPANNPSVNSVEVADSLVQLRVGSMNPFPLTS